MFQLESLADFVHGIKQSSRNLFQLLMKYVPNSNLMELFISLYSSCSKYPTIRVAYTGANFIPIAVPFTCL